VITPLLIKGFVVSPTGVGVGVGDATGVGVGVGDATGVGVGDATGVGVGVGVTLRVVELPPNKTDCPMKFPVSAFPRTR